MISTQEKFTAGAIAYLKNSIDNNNGDEVIFAAYLNEDGLIGHVEVLARGEETEVLAPSLAMEEADVVIHNHPSGVLKPSDADKTIATLLGNKGIGSYIINNSVSHYFGLVEPIKKHSYQDLNVDELVSYINVQDKSKEIEKRDSQIGLLKLIADGFNHNKLIIAEGATGVGKSFAYLIPALMWAKQNNERVLISTATIALQEQLFGKDIPQVLSMLDIDLKVVRAKGRNNYLCFLKLEEEINDSATFNTNEDSMLNSVKEWADSSQTGDKSELTFQVDNWPDLISNSDNCPVMRCPHYEKCFVFKARKMASAASVIVANHHLVFADTQLRYQTGSSVSVLPNCKKVIFDEAHNIYHSATSYFSENLTYHMLTRLLGRVHRIKRGSMSGVLISLENILPASMSKRIDKAFTAYDKAEQASRQLNAKMIILDDYNFRMTDNLNSKLKETIISIMEDLSSSYLSLASQISGLLDTLEPEEIDRVVAFEIKAVIDRCKAISTLASRFIHFDDDKDTVFWGEKTRDQLINFKTDFIATPLDISAFMQETIFDAFDTVVMTSATMAVNDNFDFFKKRLGLDIYNNERLVEAVFKTPFNYEEQAILVLPSDSLDASLPNAEDYVVTFLRNLLKTINGRTLVLFTSNKSLDSVYSKIVDELNDAGILLIKQNFDGIGKEKLVHEFESHAKAVLMGVDSFWEGIDISNKYLKNVVITKLPFSVPNSPLAAARQEKIESQGLNPFVEISLPEMVIKLKQGFGRLIRRKGDFGSVIILDKRISTKFYGKQVLSALPNAKVVRLDSNDSIKKVSEFLQEKEL